MLISDEGKCFPRTKARRVVMNILVTAHKMATAQNNIGPEWFMKREWQLAKIQYNPIFKSVRKRSKRNRIVTMKCKQLSLKLQGDFTGFRLGFKREWMEKKMQQLSLFWLSQNLSSPQPHDMVVTENCYSTLKTVAQLCPLNISFTFDQRYQIHCFTEEHL